MSRSLVSWLPAVLLATLFAHSLYDTPLFLMAAAMVPALVYALLVLRVDRAEQVPISLLVSAFLWGAVVASRVSMALNDLLIHAVDSPVAEQATAIYGGAMIEELAKGSVLGLLYWWRRDELNGVLDGVVYGAMVGIGFAMTENIQYFTLAMVQGGQPGFLRSIYTRAIVGGLNHAAFTACSGAGWGYLSQGGSYAAVAIGLAAAVAQHALWNGIASRSIEQLLCGPVDARGLCAVAPDSFSLFVMVPMVVLGFIGPGGLTLVLIARLAAKRRREEC